MQKRSTRWSEGACVIEGPDLVAAAFDADAEFEALYVAPGAEGHELVATANARGVRVYALSREALAKVADATTPQPVLASVRLPTSDLAEVAHPELAVVLCDLADPGNAGTIVRTAAAAGADLVVFAGNSVDPFNPKTLRASAGAIFAVPVAVCDVGEALDHLRASDVRLVATVARGGADPREVDLAGACALLVGSEAHGLDPAVAARADVAVTIPMHSGVESLNAGVATAIVLFEAAHQRRGRGTPSGPSSL